jgi:UDPglucose 6-dehydrogenase
VAVLGAGYVGLTTACGLAHLGHDVHCADVCVPRVAALQAGQAPILEPALEELMAEGARARLLRFGSDVLAAVRDAELTFVCVPTPEGPGGEADLSFVEAAVASIREHLAPRSILVNKSTSPIGTARRVAAMLGRDDVAVVSNPEFLREGTAVADFLRPDRIVLGASHDQAAREVAALYAGTGAPVLVTTPESAEAIKYVSNAFLAMKVSFVNVVAAICESLGADVRDVAAGVGKDHRIGPEFLEPGPGWGGSCFPKDTSALVRMAGGAGCHTGLLEQVIAANKAQYDRMAEKSRRLCGGVVAGRTVALWGLTFKPGTDDLRDSPALEVARRLAAAGAVLRAYDPAAADADLAMAGVRAERCSDPYSACRGADLVVVLTGWREFRELDMEKVASLMGGHAVLDTRNVLDAARVRGAGLQYEGVGIP